MSAEKHCPRCGQPLPASLLGGICPQCLARVISASILAAGQQRRFGEYELLEEIGRGSMGIVYKARHLGLDRIVAIKMMLSAQFASGRELERFHAEAKAIARFEHPNIVAIYEVGSCEGQPYFSMQWVAGSSLAARSRDGRARLSNREAAELLVKVARAVHHAHQRGILHRDLKPGNILLDVRGEPHVSDFGLARTLAGPSDVTVSGAVLGSPSFMPPEQAAGKNEELTTAADVYGLGAILYFLLTGRAPFAEVTPLETMRRVVEQEPVSPSSVDRAVDRDLETICLKCLQKDPQRRYASADALANDLERWLRQEPIQARPVGAVEHVIKWARRKPSLASLMAALVLVIAVGFAAVVCEWRQAEVARRRATRAEEGAVQKLYASYLAQARANRWSGRVGRRFDSLDALGKAAAIRPSLDLRNEAIACLALPDLRVERRLEFASPSAPGGLSLDFVSGRYARASPDGTIRIHRFADDQELFRLEAPRDPEWAGLMFSPGGLYLAEKYVGAHTNQLVVWDLSLRKVIVAQPMDLRCMCFRPGGKECTAAEADGCIHSYELDHGAEVWHQQLPAPVNSITYDAEGKRLAVGRGRNPAVVILDVATGATERQFDHSTSIGIIAWSRDGRWLACPGVDGHVYLHDLATGGPEVVLEGHLGVVNAALFNPGGDILATCSWDETTRFWDPKLHKQLFSLPGGWVAIALGADDRLGIGVGQREAAVWQVEPARECRRLGRTGAIGGAQFSPDGRLLAVAASDGVWIWLPQENQLLEHLDLPGCKSVFFLADGSGLVATGADCTQVWPMEYDEPRRQLRVGPARLLAKPALVDCCLGSGGRTLVAVRRGDPDIAVLELPALGAAPPGKMTAPPLAGGISASPDGKWFGTGNWKGTNVVVWDAPTRRPLRELVVKGSALCHFSPDGHWLATASDEEYRLWSVDNWMPGLTIRRDPPSALFGRMVFSPDSRVLVLLQARGGEVKFVAIPSGVELATLETGQPLCFSGDGRLLATAGEDLHSVFLWDLNLIRQRLASLNLDW